MKKISTFKKVIKEKGMLIAIKLTVEDIYNAIFYGKPMTIILKAISKKGLIQMNIHGSKMYLLPDDIGLSRQLILHKSREDEEVKILKNVLKKDMVVLEVGANLGYYALLEAQKIGDGGIVYAIEPIHKNITLLKKNINVNKYENIIKTFHLAASSKCGTSKIAVTKESNLNSILPADNKISKWVKTSYLQKFIDTFIEIETVTIDKFLRDKEMPDLIRMDIEGHETEAIKGMAKTLNVNKDMILFVELHPIYFKNPDKEINKILSIISNSGFIAKYIIKDREVYVPTEKDLSAKILECISPNVFFEKRKK